MFSYLIVALFAVLSLSVSSRPVQRAVDPCTDSPTNTTSPAPPTPTTTTSSSSPSLPTVVSDVSGGPFTDGVATYFYQGGNAGACGQVHQDTDYICAMDQIRFGTSGSASPLCGQQVQITNPSNGKSITVTIADDCPTCENQDSIDLSVGAFEALADLSLGVISISWSFV